MYEFAYEVDTDIEGFIKMLREKYPHIPCRKRLCCREDEITAELVADCAKYRVVLEQNRVEQI